MAEPTARERAAVDRRQQILTAFIGEAADYGFARISMESIAKRVGISRAQLYKYFDGRDALAEAALAAELADILERLSATIRSHDDDARAAVAETFEHAYRVLSEHPIVHRLLRTEHELMMAHLVGERTTLLMAKAWIESEFDALSQRSGTPMNSTAGAEFTLRIVLSLLVSPDLGPDLSVPGSAADVARAWILPGVFA